MLNKYDYAGVYTDCYRTDVIGVVTHKEFVASFYTTLLFKLERIILKWVVSKPSSDIQAIQLADGSTDTFAAWQVEDRCKNQLLLSDFQGRTRSWLMVAPVDIEGIRKTRLFFGSAVTPTRDAKTGKTSLGFGFSMLLGFHKLYSVLLLYSAKSNLKT
ncbi:MAG: hypothetical protein GY875_19495 [Gammaproteobacteria bacterium]|nr:hypothetical protein [Gammaproteobacteria bacterium]